MANSIKAAKQALRKEVKLRLSGLSEADKQTQSEFVTKLLFSREEFIKSNKVSVFASMRDEIQTSTILQHIFNSGRSCFIPQYVGNTMNMLQLHSYEDFLSLPKTTWNIPQPADNDSSRGEAIEIGGLDIILTPGLAFTRDGKRLGRGKGYYDNYLKKYEQCLKRKPYTIALAYYEQICETVPVTEYDVPVDAVLFQDKIN